MSATERWLRRAGGLLSLAALAYIGGRFLHSDALGAVHRAALTQAWPLHAAAALGLYLCAVAVLATGWWCLLRALTGRRPPFRVVAATYAISQFGKYLPGNVGHYLLRHAMLRRLQVPAGALLAAAGLEAAGLVSVAAALSLFVLGSLVRGLPHAVGWTLALATGAVVLAALALWRWRAAAFRLLRTLSGHPQWVLAALAAHAAFFIALAACVAMLARAMPGAAAWSVRNWTSPVAASWLAGFLVPGSPAGLGVREAALTRLLAGAAPESGILLLAAAFRVVTFGGDLLAFACGLAVRHRLRRSVHSAADGPEGLSRALPRSRG